MPTYLAVPLLTAACFLAAAWSAWLTIAQRSIIGGLLLAVLWVCFLVGTLWNGNLEGLAFVAGIVTFLGAGLSARWLASMLELPQDLTQVALVELVLAGVASANAVLARRRGLRRPPAAT